MSCLNSPRKAIPQARENCSLPPPPRHFLYNPCYNMGYGPAIKKDLMMGQTSNAQTEEFVTGLRFRWPAGGGNTAGPCLLRPSTPPVSPPNKRLWMQRIPFLAHSRIRRGETPAAGGNSG